MLSKAAQILSPAKQGVLMRRRSLSATNGRKRAKEGVFRMARARLGVADK